MNLVIKCDGCEEALNVADSQSRLADEIIIKVVPCGCKSESDCSDCEDIESYQQQIASLNTQIEVLQKELNK